MKKRFVALAIAVIFMAVGCATKPKTPTDQPADGTQGPNAGQTAGTASSKPVSQADLDALAAKAAAARKKAFDLKMFEVLPDDYKAAEETYGAAKASYDAKKNDEAKPGFEKSIALYEDLTARGVQTLVQDKKTRADEAKTAAVKQGALENAAGWFGDADKAYADAEAKAKAGDPEGAIAAYERARLLYELAQKRTQAAALKTTIEEKDLAAYDSGNYAIANEKYALAESTYAADPEAALDALDEAILRYNLVVQKGFESYAATRKAPADDAKVKADEAKANVAVKEDYAKAQALYDEAAAAMAAGRYEDAASLYDQSSGLFEAATASALEKKATAEAALQSLDAASEASVQNIIEADEAIGTAGGDK